MTTAAAAAAVLALPDNDHGNDNNVNLSTVTTEPSSSAPTSPFRQVDPAAAQGFHAWQSPASWDALDLLADEAASEILQVYEQAEALRDSAEADTATITSGTRETGTWSFLGVSRREAETRYSPGLSSFLNLDGKTGAENVRSSLITLPPVSIEAAKALLGGATVRLYVGRTKEPQMIRLYETAAAVAAAAEEEGEDANKPLAERLVDEPEDNDQVDPLELVVPWLPPTLLFQVADATTGTTAAPHSQMMYLGSHGGAALMVVPQGMRDHWDAWSSALRDPTHRIWRLAYVRLARVADRLGRPFCYQLVAQTWRQQYAMVMRMYTHVFVTLERPLTERFGGGGGSDGSGNNDEEGGVVMVVDRYHALRHHNAFYVDAVVPCASAVVGKYGMSLVVDLRSVPPTLTVSQSDAPLRRTLERMPDKRIVVRSIGAIAFTVQIMLLETAATAAATAAGHSVLRPIAIQRVAGQLSHPPSDGTLVENEIELIWALGGGTEPSMVRVGSLVRRAMGEPDERRYVDDLRLAGPPAAAASKQDLKRYDAVDRDVLSRCGRSRIQLYVVQQHERYELPPIEHRGGSSGGGLGGGGVMQQQLAPADHQRWINELHLRMRTRALHQYVLAPKLCHPIAWSQTAQQQKWGEFERYVTLRSHNQGTNSPELSGSLDVNRAITLRVLFEAEQIAHPDHRDTCVMRPVPTGGESTASPLRASLLFVGNRALRESLTQQVTAYLLPSPCVRSYMALYANGKSNTPQDMSHQRGMSADASALDRYLAKALAGDGDTITDYERTAALLTRAASDYDQPTLDPQQWGAQVPTPSSTDQLYLDDDWLASEIEHVLPWPPSKNFVPGDTHMDKVRLTEELSLMSRVLRHIEPAPNRAMYGLTSFYHDVRDQERKDALEGMGITQHVRLGLWLDGLHPRADYTQQTMRAAVLVHDPAQVLNRFGVDTLRVMIYVNYRSAVTGDRYTNAEPTVVTFALNSDAASGRVVALPYTGDPVRYASEWLTAQPLMVHGSSIEVNSPGMMLSKKLGVARTQQ